MTIPVPTSRERLFLRAIAAVNLSRQASEEDWWAAIELCTTVQFPDFRDAEVMTLAGFGKSCARKGLTERRHIGPRGHGWTEWRITSFGRGLVADSCIGGGLTWKRCGGGLLACPACGQTHAELGLTGLGEIPAHSLPGYQPQAVVAAGGPS